jgi:NADH-quinone oxidoreductase subunit E
VDPAPRPQPEKAVTPKPAKRKPAKRKVTGKPVQPKKLTKARGGKADNLQQISGIGPKLEKTLHSLGFFHFDQIADWNKDEVQWVDEHLRFKGRIDREEWIPQAKLLAKGDMKNFEKKYGSGGLKDKSGQTRSGTRTRRS